MIPLGKGHRRRLWLGFSISFAALMILLYAVLILFIRGVGIWGIQIPVAWGFAIINFVWWVGIAHAGTFISAFLLLLKQDWRNSINRSAEAMTLFAVACAGLFPLLHLGRPDLFYWLLPYPNTMHLGPQFRSPLAWDIFAVLTYLTVSALFWYLGLIPDAATMRDKVHNKWAKRFYGVLAVGWRGSLMHWRDFKVAALILAGLATPLVISVHSIVSLDFAVAQLPGWHSSIFPPYFVAGALYSGLAMVTTILLPVRYFYKLEKYITADHIEKMVFMMLLTGSMVGYGYAVEVLIGFRSGDVFEKQQVLQRLMGTYSGLYWFLLVLNFGIPNLLWFPKIRSNYILLFILTIFSNVGMWLERFIIIVASLARSFLPSEAHIYSPTIWDLATLAGTLGLFFTLLFVFIRILPLMSMFELKEQTTKGSTL
jgi:molybdopterin-containing oxidoreductase family membrane subunit